MMALYFSTGCSQVFIENYFSDDIKDYVSIHEDSKTKFGKQIALESHYNELLLNKFLSVFPLKSHFELTIKVGTSFTIVISKFSISKKCILKSRLQKFITKFRIGRCSNYI